MSVFRRPLVWVFWLSVVGGSMLGACTGGNITKSVSSAEQPVSSSPVASESAVTSTGSSARVVPKPSASMAGRPLTNNTKFHADLLKIAGLYDWMSRVDGSWWAPISCLAPVHPGFLSQTEVGPHERKIYTLFVKDIEAYAALNGTKLADNDPSRKKRAENPQLASMGQVVVKEAWTPVEATQKDTCKSNWRGFVGPVKDSGKTYYPCEQAGLFIMYQAKDKSTDTDEGWVYGSVVYKQVKSTKAEGHWERVPEVTSSGRVETCMGCHEQATHGRLFGLKG